MPGFELMPLRLTERISEPPSNNRFARAAAKANIPADDMADMPRAGFGTQRGF